MDEPLAALDTRRKGAILPYIARLPGAFDLPVIYVTHALEEVTQLCDRVVALAAGRVVATGGVAETLERLDLADVQGRFEAGSVLRGHVVAQDTALHLTRIDLGGPTLEVPEIGLAPGAEVRLRARARDVSLARMRARITRAAVQDLGLSEGAGIFALIKSVSFDRQAFPRVRVPPGGM
jgi:molybdate transport system ATP-binding protein